MPPLELYCDGSAGERVGRPGGWAFLAVAHDEVLLSQTGNSPRTTSLLMELEAALTGLQEIISRQWHHKHAITVVSDCSIILDIAAGRFMPRKYVELAQSLYAAAAEAQAQTAWVRAHSGHRWNEAVDALAHQAKAVKTTSSTREGRLVGSH